MFEIHLLVCPTQENLLNSVICRIYPTLLCMKVMATVTSTGCTRQPMLSGFCNGSYDNAYMLAREIRTNMEANGLTVVRLKIEQLILFNTNHTNDTIDTIDTIDITGNTYYESHVKIDMSPPYNDYERLARLCLSHGIQLLFNPYSNKIAPVTTMRLYGVSKKYFEMKHNEFINDLNDNEFTIYKQHLEMGVYDDNVFTDKGWLFSGDDYKIPITEVDCVERLRLPREL